MNKSPMNHQKMLKRVQAMDFATLEANLYLDTHPKSRRALAYFNDMNTKRQEAHDQYVEAYGPLTTADCRGTQSWDWVAKPWPWEMED